ncbi:MAG: hypothetical protein PARBB_00779 [Parabacteroides distasonis]|uniref:carboxypeptidase regulatory-like domain-containing protein n=1 Tax=Parabacteroides sp. TaxID=1869337 RepID=UPI0026DF8B0C|nr:carboxypeptidase regulatory-like domain-containing protein [Parabacteroides sp.]MDO5428773.1 carboxypeptidase regulatory-like domain-containing protein [Parabacteroides sp.]
MKTNRFLMGAVMLLCVTLTACDKDDPDYNKVTPPVVNIAPNTLSGIITTRQGQAINGATVSIGSQSTTTDNEGMYEISNVEAGTYTVKASATGMVTAEASITVAQSSHTMNLVWSASLNKEIVENVNVTVDEGGSGSVESEAIEKNDKARVEIKVEVPKNTVPENTTVSISPVYTEESSLIIRALRAAEDKMLIGANVSCNNPEHTLSQPFDISFKVDETITESVEAKQYINGQWVTVEHLIDNGNVVISTTTFGTFGLFFPVDITYTNSSESLTFTPSSWDNLFGSNTINATEASYTYKVGSEYNAQGANSLEALLIERLSSIIGPTYTSISGVYPLNVELPIGTALSIKGSQETNNVTVSSRNRSVSGTKYGTVTVQVSSYNREHSGGTGGSTTN